MQWTVASFPKCGFHVFLSHSAEDRPWLIEPLYDRLAKSGVIPWFDRHHYPLAVDPYEALRREILLCRFTAYLITEATLSHARGWQVIEKAYGGILQDCFAYFGIELSHIELPLFFVRRDHPVLARSAWQPLISKGRFHTPMDGDPPEWAFERISKFIREEETHSIQIQQHVANEPQLRDWVASRTGMADRLSAAYP